jgi:hypothetical protein
MFESERLCWHVTGWERAGLFFHSAAPGTAVRAFPHIAAARLVFS